MSVWLEIDCTEFERLLLSLESGQAEELSGSVKGAREEPLWDILSYEHSDSMDKVFRRLLKEPSPRQICNVDSEPSR